MPLSPRTETAFAIGDEKLFALGGWTRDEVYTDGAVYDLATRTWSALPEVPLEFVNGTATWVNGKLAVRGLADDEPRLAVFSPTTDTWAIWPLPAGAADPAGISQVAIGSSLFLFGTPLRYNPTLALMVDVDTGSIVEFDGGPLPSRSRPILLTRSNSTVTVIADSGNGTTAAAELDFETGTWSTVHDLPPIAGGGVIAGTVVLIGNHPVGRETLVSSDWAQGFESVSKSSVGELIAAAHVTTERGVIQIGGSLPTGEPNTVTIRVNADGTIDPLPPLPADVEVHQCRSTADELICLGTLTGGAIVVLTLDLDGP